MQAVTRASFPIEVLAASHAQPVLIDFWGPRCGPCLKMMPWVEQLAAQHGDRLKIVKLNADDDRRLCIELGILGLPTVVLYRDGYEVQRLSGDGCTPASIAEVVRAELSR